MELIRLDLYKMRLKNCNSEGRNVTMVVVMDVNEDGIEFREVGFYPDDECAETWTCYFFLHYIIKYAMMAEIYLRGGKRCDAIVCDEETSEDGKCVFQLPSPLGKLLWGKLHTCGLIQCGGEKRNYGLNLVDSKLPQKGYAIILPDRDHE